MLVMSESWHLNPRCCVGRPWFALAPLPSASTGSEPAVTTSSPIVLASGQITRADTLRVELHEPISTPSFVLLIWPAAPTVTNANPKALANITAAIVRIMAEAQSQLVSIRKQR
jgi:hypothetical protein